MNTPEFELLQPEWPCHQAVRALATTRHGGLSRHGYASLNLGDHVGDDAELVGQNRNLLVQRAGLPAMPRWLSQQHGSAVAQADNVDAPVVADAVWTATPGVVCAILTADCLPVVLSDRDGRCVAAAHAGWRGICAGVLEASLQPFQRCGVAAGDILAWLGPAIGRAAYEVDAVVRDSFLLRYPDGGACFRVSRPGHWQFDLCAAARQVLARQGVTHVSGGDYCTFSDERFFSYRRTGVCGRQATLIWLQA